MSPIFYEKLQENCRRKLQDTHQTSGRYNRRMYRRVASAIFRESYGCPLISSLNWLSNVGLLLAKRRVWAVFEQELRSAAIAQARALRIVLKRRSILIKKGYF
jgi:hypothetical protein